MSTRMAPIRELPAVVLAVGLWAGLGGLAQAQEPPHAEESAHAEEHERANELAVFLGGTAENDDTHFTVGGEYERRLSERFGLSFVVEHVSDTDAWVFLAPFTFRPLRGKGLKLYAGPGLENKVPEPHEEHLAEADSAGALEEGDRETFFVTRAGVGWTLEHGCMAFTPQTELDLVREDGRWDTAIVFGIAIGVGF